MTRRPDNRPDWRDPQMPVLVQTVHGLEEWEPQRLQRAMERKINDPIYEKHIPSWRNDPTYNLRRKDKQ